MISVDGMKPEYVTAADQHGLQVPFLRSLMAHGTYASVTGVWPTITYPSHTTLVTGVSPAEHGIVNNLEFDPRRKFSDSWFWYAQQIKVPTLWSAARRARLRTASVGWPATVGSTDIDFLIPEYWRIFHPTEDLNPTDRLLIEALSRPEGMVARMQRALGPYLMGNDTSLAADETKTRFALEILRERKPAFMTVHLSSLDEIEHEHGPFSTEANAHAEAIDGMLSRLVAAARANDPKAVAVVVSDHGFVALRYRVNLLIPFIQAGLMVMSADPASRAGVVSWSAEPWLAGGMAAVMLHDPDDAGTAARVRELLDRLAANPDAGVAEILDREAIAAAWRVSRRCVPGAHEAGLLRRRRHRGGSRHRFCGPRRTWLFPRVARHAFGLFHRRCRHRAPSRPRPRRHAAHRAHHRPPARRPIAERGRGAPAGAAIVHGLG